MFSFLALLSSSVELNGRVKWTGQTLVAGVEKFGKFSKGFVKLAGIKGLDIVVNGKEATVPSVTFYGEIVYFLVIVYSGGLSVLPSVSALQSLKIGGNWMRGSMRKVSTLVSAHNATIRTLYRFFRDCASTLDLIWGIRLWCHVWGHSGDSGSLIRRVRLRCRPRGNSGGWSVSYWVLAVPFLSLVLVQSSFAPTRMPALIAEQGHCGFWRGSCWVLAVSLLALVRFQAAFALA